MKYIRTKDNVWLFEDGYAKRPALNNYIMILPRSYNLENCKQADTIEELCDEFVVAYLDGSHQITSFPSKVDNMLGHSVYGAIWTDKGLIYVAKMNDKGEFELV